MAQAEAQLEVATVAREDGLLVGAEKQTDQDSLHGEEEERLQLEGEASQDGLLCAVCLDNIIPEELAVVKGCEHSYCAKCILSWAVHKEACLCPQCKVPFNYLYTYRALDGTLSDYPLEESVCLLKRAHWFQDYLKAVEKGKMVEAPAGVAGGPTFDWQDEMVAQYEAEYDDDEIEDYFFSSAAGRARITIGNRRWGENGYVAAGRMQARPAGPRASKMNKGQARAGLVADPSTPSASRSDAPPRTPATAPAASRSSDPVTPAATTPKTMPRKTSKGGRQEGSRDGGASASKAAEKVGRRARRNAQREAANARAGV